MNQPLVRLSQKFKRGITLGRVNRALIRRFYWIVQRVAKQFRISVLFLDPVNLKHLSISRFTDTQEICELLRQLRPVVTQFPLIRLGNSRDGGYLVPEDFDNISSCFSAGCDLEWSFERDLWERYNIVSNLIDEESKKPLNLPSEFTYTSAFLGSQNVMGTMKFSDWVQVHNRDVNGDLILQMDIEGFEWESIFEIPESILRNFSTLVIEFHGTENLLNAKLFKSVYRPALDKIIRNFVAVHIHGNNCCGTVTFGNMEFPRIFEVTFLRRDRVVSSSGYSELPNPLDSRNIPERDEIRFKW